MNKAFLIKNGNSWLVKVQMSVISDNPVDLEFTSGSESMDIVSTSHGFIKSGVVTLSKGCKNLNVDLEYIQDMSTLNCDLIYREPEGDRHDILLFDIPDTLTLTRFTPEIRVAERRKTDIIYKTEWELELDMRGDIYARVSKTGQPTYFSLGDMTTERGGNDFVFPAIPGQPGWSIPKEIVWMKEKDYRGEHVACFELVKVDHQNILYKIPISNKLRIDRFPKKERINISQFRDPLGLGLDPVKWSISQFSNLPVYAS